MTDGPALWKRFDDFYCDCPQIDLSLDISRIHFADSFFDEMEPRMQAAFGSFADQFFNRGEGGLIKKSCKGFWIIFIIRKYFVFVVFFQ